MGFLSALFGSARRGGTEGKTAARTPEPDRAPELSCCNFQGIGMRERQEDAFALCGVTDVAEQKRRGLLAVVCDGMGGMADGHIAGELAVQQMIAGVTGRDLAQGVPEVLAQSAHEASDAVFHQFGGASGATLIAVHILNGQMHWISVGDSAIFLLRNGGVFQVNDEHTYRSQLYAKELESEPIDRARADADPDAHRLSSFVGIDRLTLIDQSILPLTLEPGDALLLCSDGISGVLTPPELCEAMTASPEEGCKLLEEMIKEKSVPAQDNYTGILIAYR